MPLLAAALLAALAVALLSAAGRPPLDRFSPGLVRGAGALLVAALPLLYAWAVLAGAAPRLGAARIDYVGKQLAFSPELPVTVGGSDRAAGDVEDLHAARLPAATLAVRPGDDGGLELALGSPAPAVEVDGEMLNEVALADGDVVEIAGAGADAGPLRLTFTGGGFAVGEAEVALPNRLLLRLRGDDRVVFLRDLLPELAPDATVQPWSFLRLPGMASRWRLVLREREVRVVEAEEDDDEEAAAEDEEGAAAAPAPAVRGLDEVPAGSFQPRFRVPSPVRLRLGVVWGQPDRRVLAWARDDLLTRREGVLEARFAEPLRYLAEIDPAASREDGRRLAIVVPGTFDRHEMIELDEPSARFRGLSALLDLPAGGGAGLSFLGARRPLAWGEVYALGEGDDLLFLRFDRERMPWPLLLDLALLGLFLAVFLGPSLAAEPGLAAVAAPAGLLLANRLLFAWKAAHRPPAYAVGALAEARVALWLVAGLLVAGWSLAWALGRPAGTLTRRAVRWPSAGLALAAVAAWAVGEGGGRWLALVPLAAAALLLALPALAARPGAAARIASWRRDGVPWRLSWLLAAGAAILGGRLLAAALGMPEALRLPGAGRLLLWTVAQLPLAAALLAPSLVVARRRLLGSGDGAAAAGRFERWLVSPPAAVAALLAFLFLSFFAVAAAVGDLGLLLVQGLPFAVALLVLVDWPRGTAAVSPRGVAVALAVALAVLPTAGVVLVNAAPEAAVRMAAWGGAGGGGGEEAGAVPVRDRAAELSSQRAQQLFRLYLLANPSMLSEVGLEPSDRVAIQHATLLGYAEAGGWTGGGFLSAPVPRHLGETYLTDLVPMVFVLPELGKAGLLGLALLYALPLAWLALALRRRREAAPPLAAQGTALSAVALLVFALPGLYMLLANLNLVLFSGKNSPLLGLSSLSDALESALVLGLAAAGLGLGRAAAAGTAGEVSAGPAVAAAPAAAGRVAG